MSGNSKSPAKGEMQVVTNLLDLYTELLLPFMRVRRDIPFPTEPHRQETDAEHSFMLAMLATDLVHQMDITLDIGLVVQYALVHDLVEAYAGDVSVRDREAYHSKAAQEHAAYLQIKKRFGQTAPWIAELIARYEAKEDDESRFVYVADKLMGALARLADNGESWGQYYPQKDGSGYHAVVMRLRNKAAAYPDLLPLFDTLHDYLDKQWPKYLGKNSH